MAVLTLNVPTKGLTSPSSWGTYTSIKGQIEGTWNKYSKFFQFAAAQSNIPVSVLLAFAVVESGGNPSAGSGNTKNLMQANVSYMKSQLENEVKAGRLSEAEKSKLAAYGITFDANGKTRAITVADNLKPELNILIGSIILGQLIDQPWGKDADGTIRMDRVIPYYNWGLKGFNNNKIATSTPENIYKNIPSVTLSYIRKMMGKGGALDIIITSLPQVS